MHFEFYKKAKDFMLKKVIALSPFILKLR